jgi:hypothetical protein
MKIIFFSPSGLRHNFWLMLLISFSLPTTIWANTKPERVYLADVKKTKAYIKDGLIIGGDQSINDLTIKNIRHSINSEFERIVFDLEANRNGEPVAIERPPYFQFAVSPDEHKLIFSIWGNPKLDFDPFEVLEAFERSIYIQKVILLPKVEENLWTVSFELKSSAPMEIFELTQPTRLIVDMKRKK